MGVAILEFRIDRRSGVPTYQQIVQQTKQALRLGVLLPGDRLPTAKEVAESCAVNPNTTLKAYRELEREGLVEPRPGLGTFVRRSLARPQTGAGSPLRGELAGWMERARAAGLEREDVAALFASVLDERYARPATTADGASTTTTHTTTGAAERTGAGSQARSDR
ncbi:MAG: GntR family transcriptional regulator [Streptomyces sp.]|nr:GntR family transcriptional regulator [Streptomyces sp.]